MKTLMTLTLACCLAIASAAYTQPDSLWSKTYGGDSLDVFSSLVQTSDGDYIMAGWTNSYHRRAAFDYWLVKANDQGDTLWTRVYGTNQYEECYSLIGLDNGNFAAGGLLLEDDIIQRYWLLILDADGDSLTSFIGDDSIGTICIALASTDDGKLAVAGGTFNEAKSGNEFWLMRMDYDGEVEWTHSYEGPAPGACLSLIQMGDHGYALGGTVWYDWNRTDGMVVRTNENGDSLWSYVFGEKGRNACRALIQTEDGGLLITGSMDSSGAGGIDGCLVRLDSVGGLVWSRTYGGNSDDHFSAVVNSDDDGYVLAGTTGSFSVRRAFWLLKVNSHGDSIWSQTFGGETGADCYAILKTIDGGFALAGEAESGLGFYRQNGWLVKTGPDPVSVPESDFILQPSAFILSPPFPNPFNSTTVVGYSAPGGLVVGWMNLSIYDLSGRMVQTLANGYQSAGPHTLVWNAPDLAAGEYVIVLTGDEGKSEARKVVLLK